MRLLDYSLLAMIKHEKKLNCINTIQLLLFYWYILSISACKASSRTYSSYDIILSTMPLGVNSINRLAILSTNWWSLDVNKIDPLNLMSPLLTAVIDSKSRWAVGSSNIRTFALDNIILDSIQRTFSPPDKTLAFLRASSPENSMRPKKPLKKVSV